MKVETRGKMHSSQITRKQRALLYQHGERERKRERERERERETYRGYPKAKRGLQVKHKQKAEHT
jgi:hypothetical protein